MERCPNCGARCDGGDLCRRCGLELTPLLAVERAADRLTASALLRLAEGDAAGALTELGRACALRREPLVDLLVGFVQGELRGLGAIGAGVATSGPPEPTVGGEALGAQPSRALVDLADWPIVPASDPDPSAWGPCGRFEPA